MTRTPQAKLDSNRRWRLRNAEKLKQQRHQNPEKFQRRRREYRQRNPEKVALADRKRRLQKKFGLTIEEYDALLHSQNYVCAICKKTEKENGRALPVDHDHQTGKLRAILCNSCNVMLGMANDSPDLLRAAAAYLDVAALI